MVSFGIYINVTLKDARTKKDEAKYSLANNVNPISIKKAKKTSETITLNDVIEEWLELRKKSKSEATIIQNKRILKNITIWLGNISIKDENEYRICLSFTHQAIKLIQEIEPYSRHRSEFVFPSPQKSDRGVSGATLSDTLIKDLDFKIGIQYMPLEVCSQQLHTIFIKSMVFILIL